MTRLPAATPYFGNAPYCYTHSLLMVLGRPDLSAATMVLGRPDLSAATVETLTGSAFGFQLLGGHLPLFDPPGWDPNLGLDQALGLLGYSWQTQGFGSPESAWAALRAEAAVGPVFVGPLDMGLLRHQPESDRASGADHFVVVLEVQDHQVWLHDPQGHPWAALPRDLFLEAWQATAIGYAEPFTLRRAFGRVRPTETAQAVRALLPLAAAWVGGHAGDPVPGTVGGRLGLDQLARQVEQDLTPERRGVLMGFSVRVGARRRADAAYTLAQTGAGELVQVLQAQAQVLGGLQYAAVTGDQGALATGFRRLGQLDDDLRGQLGHFA